MDGTSPVGATPPPIMPFPDQIGRVYRCAWCRRDPDLAGSMPFYTYRADGSRIAAAPADWSGSDGICPGHGARVRAGHRLPDLAA